MSCSKGGGGDDTAAPVTPVVVLNPGKPSLVYPDNGAPCEDGTSINDTQSEINFQWTAAENAESYLLSVTNLSSNSEQTFNSAVANISVALLKADPYRWTVTAQGKAGSTPSVSDAWKFYLAGDAQVNYAPFPPELLAPTPGSTVFAILKRVTNLFHSTWIQRMTMVIKGCMILDLMVEDIFKIQDTVLSTVNPVSDHLVGIIMGDSEARMATHMIMLIYMVHMMMLRCLRRDKEGVML